MKKVDNNNTIVITTTTTAAAAAAPPPPPPQTTTTIIIMMMMMMIIMMMIMMIITRINLIYIAQFDTSSILTALYIVKAHTDAIYARMNIHETIIFMHIYMPAHSIHIPTHVQIYIDI